MRDDGDSERYPYLSSLNAAQLRAVTAPPGTPLQILAGPGSGKTRVLTSRVAHLVKKHKYKPYEITAVTFTNKAANEMRKRLKVLLGEKEAGQLVLGTFHATCARYLRRHGSRIDLDNNFAISDADDCKKIMSRLLKARAEELAQARISLKEGVVLNDISKAKAKGESPEGMAVRAAKQEVGSNVLAVIAQLYKEYELALRDAGALDFDDLLVFGLRLFKEHPDILAKCLHILVDEFQDTNTTQYELMKCFARANGGVSVVGDPDQSIYGWRSAEIENLDNMKRDFKGVDAIYLEHNYRSTGAILAASHSIVSQDAKRIPKNLYTSHPKSTPANLKQFATPVIEASFISTEIKRLIAYSGGLLNYDDFSILLRYNALSRVIESALQKDGIPNRIIGGHKFFERMEIKDLLAYLQLADNPNFTPAFLRVVNVPRRGIGDKSVSDLVAAAKRADVSPMELAERIIDGDKLPTGIKPAMKRNLASFVGVVRKLRRAALKGSTVGDIILLAIKKTEYEEYLRSSQPDYEQRWENVQELINYSVVVSDEQGRQDAADADVAGAGGFTSALALPLEDSKPKVETKPSSSDVRLHPMFQGGAASGPSRRRSTEKKVRVKIENDVVEILSSEDELDEPDVPDVPDIKPVKRETDSPSSETEGLTPLRFFLQTSMLSTDTESQEEGAEVPKVTISTVHAAKGLEWPVVFIPSVEQGTFPFHRCTEEHEVAEERRLLYVAMTRAQSFLFLSHSATRMWAGQDEDRDLSEFVAKSMRKDPNLFSSSLPTVDVNIRHQMSTMLGRPLPNEAATKEAVMKHVRAAPPLSTWDAPEPRGKNRFARREGPGQMSRAADYWNSGMDEYALPSANGSGRPSFMTFSSARSLGRPVTMSAPAAPKSPPAPIKSANRNLPAPLPFTFDASSRPRPEANLTSFTSNSNSALAAMKSLGLPDSKSGAGSKTNLASFTSNSSSSLAAMKTLGQPDPLPGASLSRFSSNSNSSLAAMVALGRPEAPGTTSIGGSRTSTAFTSPTLSAGGDGGGMGGDVVGASGSTGVPGIPLARGTKRLGMGRPAPWGSKRNKS